MTELLVCLAIVLLRQLLKALVVALHLDWVSVSIFARVLALCSFLVTLAVLGNDLTVDMRLVLVADFVAFFVFDVDKDEVKLRNRGGHAAGMAGTTIPLLLVLARFGRAGQFSADHGEAAVLTMFISSLFYYAALFPTFFSPILGTFVSLLIFLAGANRDQSSFYALPSVSHFSLGLLRATSADPNVEYGSGALFVATYAVVVAFLITATLT